MFKENESFVDWSIISMTGSGHAIINDGDFSLEMSLKSLNQRGLDIKYRMPPELHHFEPLINRVLSESFSRGRIDVQVALSYKGSENHATLDRKRAFSLIKELNEFYDCLGDTVLPLSMGDLLALPGVITEQKVVSKEILEALLKSALEIALKDLVASRTSDGKALIQSIDGMLAKSHKLIKEIESLKGEDVKIHFEKLKGRCDELFSGYNVNLERIYQESALLAERSDFTEELHRLMAHVEFFVATCTKNEPKGRKLDFICQEMLRESNTLLSKAFDHKVSILGIELKAEIEKIREQVQNIE